MMLLLIHRRQKKLSRGVDVPGQATGMVTAGDDRAGVGSRAGNSWLRSGQAATLQPGRQRHDAVVAALRYLGGLF
jgi:hypothetical protein